MDGLGKMLRGRAKVLGLSDSEVARRLGLSQARYHNYVSDAAEPDLGTLVRICRVLGTSPDEILSFSEGFAIRTASDVARARVASAATVLEGDTLTYTADLVEAMVTVQRSRASASRRATRSRDDIAAGRLLASAPGTASVKAAPKGHDSKIKAKPSASRGD